MTFLCPWVSRELVIIWSADSGPQSHFLFVDYCIKLHYVDCMCLACHCSSSKWIRDNSVYSLESFRTRACLKSGYRQSKAGVSYCTVHRVLNGAISFLLERMLLAGKSLVGNEMVQGL